MGIFDKLHRKIKEIQQSYKDYTLYNEHDENKQRVLNDDTDIWERLRDDSLGMNERELEIKHLLQHINFLQLTKEGEIDLVQRRIEKRIKKETEILERRIEGLNIPGDLQKTFFENSKNIESEFFVINAKKNGTMKVFYESGQLRTEMNFKDDLPDGIGKGFFENGKIQTINHFKIGKENGKFISYHTNGNIHTEYNYVNGFQHGKQENWFESGTIDVEKNMKHGEKHGWSRNYFNNGQIEFEGKYSEGEQIGSHKTWDEEGNLIDETHY